MANLKAEDKIVDMFLVEYANETNTDVEYWAKKYKRSVSTIYKWTSTYKQKLHELKLAKKKQIQEKALNFAGVGLDVLNEATKSEDESIRVRAAQALVSAGLPSQSEIEINDRQIDITITGLNSQNNSKNKGDVSANNGKG